MANRELVEAVLTEMEIDDVVVEEQSAGRMRIVTQGLSQEERDELRARINDRFGELAERKVFIE